MSAQSKVVFIAYGTNVRMDMTPERQSLPHIVGQLKSHNVIVDDFSRLWLSSAWPDPSDPPYHNAVIRGRTHLTPAALLQLLHDIEADAGRVRAGRANAPRTLDLDLIAYGDAVIAEDGLIVPHPRAHDRAFVMGPLAEIDPDWVHPQVKKTAADLYRTATIGRDAYPLDAES
jgi:2-amino-4-hydroxy-6-hydroxymethyldihydropteridine diphosphokinase